MKKKLFTLLSFAVIAIGAAAQENPDTLTQSVSKILSDLDNLKKIQISGYIQPQFQVADSTGQSSFAGGDFSKYTDKRFMLRRGRLKVAYTTLLTQWVFQMDMTEKGLTIKDAYGKFTDPWIQTISLTCGMQNRPFGFEIPYSSSLRESPERGRMSQIIFPNERDLGAMITIQAPKTSKWNMIKFDIGMFNGTGAPSAGANTSDFDVQKDLISHLMINKASTSQKIKFGIGVSYYNGGYRQGTSKVYSNGTDSLGVTGFMLDRDTVKVGQANSIVKRQYIGFDAQFSLDWIGGITTIRGEYIMGQQPGTSATTTSPAAQPTADCYVRNFNGAYFYFLQNIMQTKHQLVFKYDWYDPNTNIAGDAIGKSVVSGSKVMKTTGSQDIKWTTIGIGYIYHWDANVKIMAYYDMVTNEFSKNLSGFTKDKTDNVFTLRIQYKF